MIVLIDTSVWLRFLRGEEAGLVARPWITSGQALVHPFVEDSADDSLYVVLRRPPENRERPSAA